MKNPIKILFICILSLWCVEVAIAQQHSVASPDGKLKLTVITETNLSYKVDYKGKEMIKPSEISMTLQDGKVIGKNVTVIDVEENTVNQAIDLVYGISETMSEHYTEKTINFQEDFSLVIRAYNEGVAYRFVTKLGGDIIVKSEQAEFNIVEDPATWYPLADDLMRSFERAYVHFDKVSNINSEHGATTSFAITPTLFSYDKHGVRLVIGESDVSDYPGLYIDRASQNSNQLVGKWAAYPKRVSEPENIYAYHRVEERYDYIAATQGTRSFPWRVIIATDDDKTLLTNQLIFKLAQPLQLTNTDWIKPGKSVWEWWHDAILEGIDESSKVSLEKYKYYIDYGAEHGFEYLTMDAGWDASFAADVVKYAATKGMRVIAWDFINMPIEDPNRLNYLKSLGIAGVKVDLIERDDQISMNWVETLAKQCAEKELLLVLHGCPVPTGLERAYPNIINYEAVRGAECLKWDDTANPNYHVEFPFIRMLAGPLDYTPGSMRNVTVNEFKPIGKGIPNSMGSRSHELAMYIMYYQPMAYFCDSPIEYAKYPTISKFFEVLPTVWDESIALDAVVGNYAVMARRKGDDWFVGGMTNTEARNFKVDFSFLPLGTTYTATIFKDAKYSKINAKLQDVEVVEVTSSTILDIAASDGGGFVIYLSSEGNALTEKEEETDDVKENIIVYLDESRSNLIIKTKVEQIKNVQIFDSQGKLELRFSPDRFTDLKEQSITALSLSNGVHSAIIVTDKKTHKVKFVK